jgi:hypothetical protein
VREHARRATDRDRFVLDRGRCQCHDLYSTPADQEPAGGEESAMSRALTVLPPGFELRPAERGALATCWLVDLGMALIMGLSAAFATAVALSLVAVRPGGPTGHGELAPWAVVASIGLGCAAAVSCLAFGTGGRSVGHQVAELRVASVLPAVPDAFAAEVAMAAAGPVRRAVRGAAPVAVFVALAWRSVPLAAAVAVVLWLPSLLRANRRGPYELIAGVADVSLEPMR